MALIGDYELSLKNFCHTFVDGTRVQLDTRKLMKNGMLVAVGTPGRVYDLIKNERLLMANLKVLVLDDADDMLSQGFSRSSSSSRARSKSRCSVPPSLKKC